jgi:very-short-patch-repair endonuclease
MKGQTNKVILRNKLQRNLRHKMTDAELRIWRHLRGRQMHVFKFRRQHPFEGYILDFVCMEQMVVIEIDGGLHAINAVADGARTKALEVAGFRVLRFWNNQVLGEMDAVKAAIWNALSDPSPPQSSP